MRFQDLIKFAWKSLTDRKLRAALTILGIVIGPATIVALVGLTGGLSNSVTAQFASTGTTSIYVSAAGRGAYLSYTDVPTLQAMAGVAAVAPFYLLTGTITQGPQTTDVQIIAMNPAQLNQVLPSLTLQSGALPSSDNPAAAAIGSTIANPNVAGVTGASLNQVVSVTLSSLAAFGASGASGSKSFLVTGIYAQFGTGFELNPDVGIFVPLSAGQSLTHSSHYSGIIVVATSTNTVTQVTNEITAQYGTTVRATAITSLLSTIQSVLGTITLLLGAVAGISVVVAFIGIMTTMFTTVIERTKEIGILKAIGYTSRNILSVFLVESGLTGFIGGVIGAVAGSGMSFVIIDLLSRASFGASSSGTGFGGAGAGGAGFAVGGASAARGAAAVTSPSALSSLTITPAITPELLALAILLATAVGTVAGLIPAWRASRLPPVEALRQE